jgi:hypothetical protein
MLHVDKELFAAAQAGDRAALERLTISGEAAKSLLRRARAAARTHLTEGTEAP